MPHARVLDSEFQVKDLGLWIPVHSEIADSKAQDSGDSTSKIFPDVRFHKQNFPRFQIPQAKILQIPESRLP